MPVTPPGRFDSPAARRVLACLVLVAALILGILLARKSASPADLSAKPIVSHNIATPAGRQHRDALAATGLAKRDGVNGAELYAQAMGLFSKLSQEDRDALNAWSGNSYFDPDWSHDPKVHANPGLFQRIQPILALLHKAREADYVEWSFEPGNGEGAEQLWVLSDVGLWGAAYQFQSDPRAAVANLADVQALEHGITADTDSLGFSSMSWFGHEVFTLLSQNAPLLSSASPADLDYILDPSGATERVQDSIADNITTDQKMIDQYTNPETRAGSQVLEMSGTSPTGAADVLARLQWQMKAKQDFAQILSESPAQIQQWLDQLRADPAYPKDWGMELGGTWANMEEEVVQTAMVRAALALEQGNLNQYQSIKDPATGAPFAYTQTDAGFQLASTLPVINDPTVIETVGSFHLGQYKTEHITNKAVGGQTVTLSFPWSVPSNQ